MQVRNVRDRDLFGYVRRKYWATPRLSPPRLFVAMFYAECPKTLWKAKKRGSLFLAFSRSLPRLPSVLWKLFSPLPAITLYFPPFSFISRVSAALSARLSASSAAFSRRKWRRLSGFPNNLATPPEGGRKREGEGGYGLVRTHCRKQRLRNCTHAALIGPV